MARRSVLGALQGRDEPILLLGHWIPDAARRGHVIASGLGVLPI